MKSYLALVLLVLGSSGFSWASTECHLIVTQLDESCQRSGSGLRCPSENTKVIDFSAGNSEPTVLKIEQTPYNLMVTPDLNNSIYIASLIQLDSNQEGRVWEIAMPDSKTGPTASTATWAPTEPATPTQQDQITLECCVANQCGLSQAFKAAQKP